MSWSLWTWMARLVYWFYVGMMKISRQLCCGAKDGLVRIRLNGHNIYDMILHLLVLVYMDMGSSVPLRQGTESASTVQNAPIVSNLPKKRSATSDVWNYFVSLGVGEDGKPRAKCKGCDEVYIAGGSSHGTSSLTCHILKCSKLNSYHNVGNMLIDHAGKLRSRKISQKVLRSLTAMAIIRYDLPFSVVEYEGVREIFKYCNPDVKFITRNTTVAEVWKVYKSKKESLKQELGKIPSRICLTSDEKFDKYWSEYSVVLALGAILDPRLKFPLLERCFNRVDPTTCQSKLDVVRKKLFELFNAYASNSSSSSSSSSSQCQIQPPNIPTNSETGMGFSTFTALMDFDSEIVSQLGKSQLELYLEEAKLEFKFHKDLDVLRYWKDNRGRFPDLSLMAFDILSIPITTVASESAFNIGSRVLNKYHSCLLPEKVQALLCTRNWLIGFNVEDANVSFSSTPNEVDSPSIAASNITIEDDEDDVEML
ncbi:zinc finger BED domain-containing protein DAYSLEEPER-like [Senna tora]|uniref:Zinc finger BED domain-containing protein DAYSLEEPER-like n=1 Tax=Senna tora TaxID=362788 RepID=A0A834TU27_9FABA|nr:zinc finger BED domain-containing protein DAYSLEEPER-like [Senna tora]